MNRLNPLLITLSVSAFTLIGCTSNRSGLFNDEPAGAGNGSGGGSGSGSGGSGGSGSGATDAGGAGGSAGGATCEALELSPERIATYIEFAIDSSGSMGVGGNNNWDAKGTAFASAFNDYPGSVHAGATVFPGIPDTSLEYCYAAKQNIPMGPVDGAQSLRFEKLFLAHTPGGGSPTHAAMRFGYRRLGDVAAAAPGLRVLVLITDGKANYGFGESGAMGTDCVGDGTNRNPAFDEALMREVRAAAADGVYTFAVGLPGSEAAWGSNGWDAGYADILSAIAREGGTAAAECEGDECHIDLSSGGADLGDWIRMTVQEIGPAVQSCTFPVPASDDHDVDELVVQYQGADGVETLALAADCTNDPGYQVTPGYLHLCGETCGRSVDEDGSLQLKLPCR